MVTNEENLLTGLDYHFLRYIGVYPETQKHNQSIYLPFFEHCHEIVDLGCGDGDFVELLREHNKEAIGVDSDPQACEVARRRGIPIICEDVFVYLENLSPDSLDGIFTSHLVEHLPYQKVLQLFALSYRALRPNGVIVVTTPNVRGLISHLEMFWLHFGHVNFYHPRLLCFFLEHVGFAEPIAGENEHTASPLLVDLRTHFSEPPPTPEVHEPTSIDYQRLLPLQGRSWWRRLSRSVKMFLARMIVLPYLDQLVGATNGALASLYNQFHYELQIKTTLIATALMRLDRPFECYVTARRPGKVEPGLED